MIITNPDSVRNHMSLVRIEKLSPQLALDISRCIERYRTSPERWKLSPSSVRGIFSVFIPAFGALMECVDARARIAITDDGLDALHSEWVWAEFEGATFKLFDGGTKVSKIRRALCFCAAVHFNQPDLRPPGDLVLRSGYTDVCRLYRVSIAFLLTYRNLLLAIDARAKAVSVARIVKEGTYVLLGRLIERGAIRDVLERRGFAAFSDSLELLTADTSETSWRNSREMRALLSEFDPVHWARKTAALFGHVDLTDLYVYSPVIYEEVNNYAATLASRPLRGRRKETIKDQLSQIKRVLLRLLDILPLADAINVRMRGLCCFVENEAALLIWISSQNICPRSTITTVRGVVDTLFPERRQSDNFFTPYRLAFQNPYSDRPIYCDYEPVRSISIELYDDLVRFLGEQTEIIDQSSFNVTTLRGHFVQFKTVLMLVYPELGDESLRLLREHGMQAFCLDGNRIQKEIFACLQNAVRTRRLKTSAARSYRRSLEWIIVHYGFEVASVYTIPVSRTKRHLERLNADDYYTSQQCREIAFNIEILLRDVGLSIQSRLSLMVARIILKTGWSVSMILDMQCEDITRVPTPLNSNGRIAVVTRKARAGYRSDTWTFIDRPRNATALRSAATDLMLVRDELTASLRKRLPDSNPYRQYVFILERNDTVERLSGLVTKNVTEMLRRCGCNLNFNSKKIRKGGVNYIYRRLQRDLQSYESVAGHNFATYEASYHRIDENQSRYSLSYAIDVMGKYFIGKEISEKIVILKEQPEYIQHTPTGECASPGNDSEAARYNREHRKLHEQREVAAQFCGDFLSCVWCKFYRAVADPEHVWKLISYRDYVLFSMQVSALESDEPDDQHTHIEMLLDRVSKILERMEIAAPGVMAEGEALIRNNGMHPDWSFALADVPRTSTIRSSFIES